MKAANSRPRRRRLSGAVLALLAACSLVLAPASPAWAKQHKVKNDLNTAPDGDSNVAAYMIVVVGLGVGMAVICRKSYRSTEVKRREQSL